MLFIMLTEFHFSFYPFHKEFKANEQGQSGPLQIMLGFSTLLKKCFRQDTCLNQWFVVKGLLPLLI